jgi:hypothetical protein
MNMIEQGSSNCRATKQSLWPATDGRIGIMLSKSSAIMFAQHTHMVDSGFGL